MSARPMPRDIHIARSTVTSSARVPAPTGSSSPPTPGPSAGVVVVLPRLVRRQPGLLRGLDRSPGPVRANRDLPAVSERRGDAPQGVPAQCRGRRFGMPWGCSRPARSTCGPTSSRVALIGHSAGGNLAAQIAAVAADPHSGLPQLKAGGRPDARRGLALPRAETGPHPRLDAAARGRRRGRSPGGGRARAADLHADQRRSRDRGSGSCSSGPTATGSLPSSRSTPHPRGRTAGSTREKVSSGASR